MFYIIFVNRIKIVKNSVIIRIFTVIFILLLTTIDVGAQRWRLKRFESIFNIGATTMMSDVGLWQERPYLVFNDFNPQSSRLVGGYSVAYKLRELHAVKANLLIAHGYGTDKIGRNPNRGYVFNTLITEFSCEYHYYILREERRIKSAAVYRIKGMVNNYSRVASYLYIGAGAMVFNPNLKLTKEYDNKRDSIKVDWSSAPLFFGGLALKYYVNSNISLSASFEPRITFSDFIDGVKPRNSLSNDVVCFTMIRVIKKVRTDRRGRPMIFNKKKR